MELLPVKHLSTFPILRSRHTDATQCLPFQAHIQNPHHSKSSNPILTQSKMSNAQQTNIFIPLCPWALALVTHKKGR